MLPLKDDNPTRTVPFVTLVILSVNIALFIRELSLPHALQDRFIHDYGVIPSEFIFGGWASADRLLYNGMTLFTAMFLHGSISHLAGNMLYLWIFGNNVEEMMGHGRFLVFYLLCGTIGSITQIVAAPKSQVPMIGASGAIAGVLGAYMVLFPAARVLTLIFVFFFARVVAIPAVIIVGFWFLLQLIQIGPIGPGGVAVMAHVGGFVAGLLFLVPFRRQRPRQSLY